MKNDLIILDLMLSDKDGLSICKELRNNEIDIPILMLTARDTLRDKVIGLNSGAEDYLTKPFAFEEFLPRVRALLCRKMISDHVWNEDFDPFTNITDININYLCNKIDKDFTKPLIQTIRCVGYILKE